MDEIRVAIAGMGNCASSLVQGIYYYADVMAGGDGDGAVGLLHPRLGGYEPKDMEKPATIVTRAAVVSGEKLCITADIDSGSLGVILLDARREQVLATGRPFTRDVTNWAVSFADAAELSKFRGRSVRLKFELKKAKLYSFAFCGE